MGGASSRAPSHPQLVEVAGMTEPRGSRSIALACVDTHFGQQSACAIFPKTELPVWETRSSGFLLSEVGLDLESEFGMYTTSKRGEDHPAL